MIFLTDTAFAIELIALSLGAGLLIWALRNQGKGIVLGKVIGSIVLILSIFMLLCTTYSGLKYWGRGSCEMSSDMTRGMSNEMRQKMIPLLMQKMIPQVMEKTIEQMGNMGDMQDKEQMKNKGNMYNMEHLQNMGSKQSMKHMQQKNSDNREPLLQ